jgi:hypothetical protein
MAHRHFKQRRSKGEWFRVSVEDAIRSIATIIASDPFEMESTARHNSQVQRAFEARKEEERIALANREKAVAVARDRAAQEEARKAKWLASSEGRIALENAKWKSGIAMALPVTVVLGIFFVLIGKAFDLHPLASLAIGAVGTVFCGYSMSKPSVYPPDDFL